MWYLEKLMQSIPSNFNSTHCTSWIERRKEGERVVCFNIQIPEWKFANKIIWKTILFLFFIHLFVYLLVVLFVFVCACLFFLNPKVWVLIQDTQSLGFNLLDGEFFCRAGLTQCGRRTQHFVDEPHKTTSECDFCVSVCALVSVCVVCVYVYVCMCVCDLVWVREWVSECGYVCGALFVGHVTSK